MSSFTAVLRARLAAGTTVAATVIGLCVGISVAVAPVAHADTSPPSGTPATVSADPLPTVQQNGVIWSEVTVGNTVYAAGSFSQTWPAGTSNTTANDTPRANLLAFNITTGALTSFNHVLNAQALSIAASPNGSTVYVGGNFTTVDGVTRNHIAAFSTSTGALLSTFAPSVSGPVQALAVSPDSSTVYFGGNFFSVNGVARTRLAAATASGALTTWAPVANDNIVTAMVVTPDQSEVVIGGRFSQLNGTATPGLGAVTTANGSLVPYAVNQQVQDYTPTNAGTGIGAGIESLYTDGTQVYGSGYSYGAGNFEGVFGVSPDSGQINFLNDCHGDTYDVFATGQVLYDVSHEHDCSAVGDFPDTTTPRVWHHATAWTTYPTGTNTGPDAYGWNYNGVPDSTLLNWFPNLAIGSVTGQSQAAWAVTGNSNYIALGGEFPSANGVAQAGIVRYAISSLAPNKVGPTASSSLTPTAVSYTSGTAQVSWQATWDQDNATLTYNVLRDGSSKPVYTVTQTSNFWTLPRMTFSDTGLTPGSSHTYRIQVVDPFGNKITSSSSAAVTVSSQPASQYATDVSSDGASNFWRFGDASGSTAADWISGSNMAEGSGVTDGAAGPISGDPTTAATFSGTSSGEASTTTSQTAPNTFTVEAWFQTTTTSGGKIVGFGNAQQGSYSTAYDRQIYMNNAGQLVFGVYNGSTQTLTTSKTYNDGNWHYVVAELSPAGMSFYVDGVPVGSNAAVTAGQAYSGYWRVGGDNLNGWPSQPTSNDFAGTIGDVAVYPSVLSVSQLNKHYTDSGRTSSIPPAPTDAYGKAVYQSNPELFWRLGDAAGSATAADTSPYSDNGVVSGGVTFGQPGRSSSTTSATFDGASGTIASTQSFANPTVYSEELWFNTTTQSGGKLIGFGDQQSGYSANYDRHVYMLNTGQLEFGTWTGQTNTIVSPKSYNDGNWHYLVATQGPDGMNLYVDGVLVGSNSQSAAQSYTGYWRIGGDQTWGGASSNYFAGSLQDVAVYPSELSASQVQAHYQAAGGTTTATTVPSAVIATPSCVNLVCSFDGSGSTDQGGTITGYSWSFGDQSGATSTAATPSYTYASPGTYTVALTVTDSGNQTSTTTTQVTVTSPPTASFTSSCTVLTCSFNASGSSATGGASISSYAWNFGDGSTGTGASPSHTYASAGTQTVTLTVTDSNGRTATTTSSVTPTSPPTASFTSSCTAQTCSFNASGSSGTGGATITSYAWNFGDGSTGVGATPSHTYAAAGAQSVTLTVTDSNGNTATTTQTANPASTYATDNFNRTVTGGWGSATTGGNWTATGSSTGLSVSGGVGSIALSKAGAGAGVYLPSVSATSTSTQVTMTTSATPTGSGTYLDVEGRHVSSSAGYRGRVILGAGGTVTVALLAINGSTQTVLKSAKVSGLTYTPGMQLVAQVVVSGTSPTTLSMKVWQSGTTPPSAWQVTTTDSTTALQVAGSVGLWGYLSSNATTAPMTEQFSSFSSAPVSQ